MRSFYVAGQLIDLYPSTVIAQTLQVFDPGKVGSIFTSYTSSIKAPLTQNNRKIFGFLDNTKTLSDIPYSSLGCNYYESGFPIIRSGRIVVTGVVNQPKGEISFTVYSGAWGFFQQIEDKTLWNLDFTDINGPWNQAARDGYRNAATGILQALVDDGRLDQNAAATAPTIENQGTIIKCPQVYYHTILAKIFEGFEVTGDIFDNEIMKALAMPLGVVYNDPTFLESKGFFAAAPGTQNIVDPVAAVEVIFSKNVKQGSENFWDGVSQYVVVNPDTIEKYFRITFYLQLQIEVTGGTVDIQIEASTYTATVLSNVGTGSYSLQFLSSLGHADGEIVKVSIIKNTGTPVVDVLSGSFYTQTVGGFDAASGMFFSSIVPGWVYFNKLFEKISLLDFLKDFCVRFGVQITQRNNVLEVNTFNKILDVRSGPDWTAKRHDVTENIKYIFNTYGKTNYIKTPTDTEFTPDFTDEYGDGKFQIPNANLKESATLYTSIFYISEMVTTFGVFMLKLNLEPDLSLFKRMPGNRLFFVRDKYDFEPPVLYDAIDRTDYKVGYYFDPNQTREMSFQFFVDNFYQKFLDRCLRRTRVIERDYNLSDLDIYQFDQQVPIYDDNERFLVTKISNRVSRKAARVELLRIDPSPAVTYKEQYLAITIVNFLQQMGEASNIRNFLQTFAATLTNASPFYRIRLALTESITGNPTWRATTYNGTVTHTQDVIGDFSVSNTTMPLADYMQTTVVKINNNGNGPTGFPVVPGYVEWMLNGVRVFTKTFNTANHSSIQGLNYTFGRQRTLRASVRVTSIVNVNLATGVQAGSVIDGVALISGDRVLLQSQTSPAQNGVWQAQPTGSPFRPLDNDTGTEISDTAIQVTAGTVHAGRYYQCTNTGSLTPDVTPVGYSRIFILAAGDQIRINVFENGATP